MSNRGRVQAYGRAVAVFRTKAKLSQPALARLTRSLAEAKVADAVPVSQTTIAMIEIGERNPSVETLRSLAVALDVDPEALGRIIPDDEAPCSTCCGRGSLRVAS